MSLWWEYLIKINPFSRPGVKRTYTRNIVWHWTANRGATALNHVGYFGTTLANQNPFDDKKDTYASAQLFVDRWEAILIIPFDELAYHASQANPYSIGVELCIEADGTFHPDTIARAVQIGAELCRMYGLSTSDFMRHFDVTGKDCPKPWVDDPSAWEDFKRRVDAVLIGEEDDTLNYTTEQWGQVAQALMGYCEQGLIEYKWVEKAYQGTLTKDDLIFITLITSARKDGFHVD